MSDKADPRDAADAIGLWFSMPSRDDWVRHFAGMSDAERKAMYFQAWDIGEEPSFGAKWDTKTGAWKRVK